MAEEFRCKNESRHSQAPDTSSFSLYRFASRWDQVLISVGLIASCLSGMAQPYAITLVASIFQSMIDYTKAYQKSLESDKEFLRTLQHFGIQYTIIGFILFIGGYLGTTLLNISAIRQATQEVHKHYRDIIKLEGGIGEKMSSLIYNLSIGMSSVAMALGKGWKLALLCLVATPLTLLLVGLTGMLANKWYKKQSAAIALASAVAEEALSSIKTVYAFNGQHNEIERYHKHLIQITKITIKKELFTGLSMGCLYFCVFGSYALSFYFGIYLIINEPENYNADVMFSVFFGVMTAMGSFGTVGTLMTPVGQSCGAAAQIFHLVDNVPKINPLLDKGSKPSVCKGNVEFRNVIFQYPTRPEISVLKGVSLSVERGQSVALVGESGSGKSTIMHLISRFYDVDEGSVSIDGHDVRDLSVRWVRAQVGLVGQEPVLFNTTVRENIRYGREGASDEDVEAAARQANAHQFIMKLPSGYATMVGQLGEFLSGGQKQRIAIARALIRNPSILLLDEPTSALDIDAEAEIKVALDNGSEGRSTIIVAHRLSTIRNVDVVHVMREGEIVESGNHEKLLKAKGYYYSMWLAQEPPEFEKVERKTIMEDTTILKNEQENTDDAFVDEKSVVRSHVSSLSFRQVLALNAPEWKYILSGSLCATINGFSTPVFIIIFGSLLGSMSKPDTSQLMSKVEYISMMCLSVGFLLGISNFIETTSFGVAGTRLTERLRLRMFTHMMRQDVAFFELPANSTGAMCARLATDAPQVQGATGQRIGIVLQSMGSVGLSLILGMLFEWRVGMIILAFVPFIALIVYKQGKATYKESSASFNAIENSTKIAVEAVSNIRTVTSLGLEQSVVAQYVAALRPALRPCVSSAHCRGFLSGLSRSMFNFINAAALTYGGHLIVHNGVTPGDILVTTQALQMASAQAQNAFSFAPDLHKGISAASRIALFVQSKAHIVDPKHPAIKGFKSISEASLENVEFRYPTRPTIQVLRGLTMEVARGQTIAVVGPSGCGKSTIIQLLLRYYDPQVGMICLDKIPLQHLQVNDIRCTFGLVSQEPVLFARSIRENIAYGDTSRSPSDEEVHEAAKQANIHSFVVSLPMGYDTDIGTKGVQLSGGQKQRIAIARALVRRPNILLLDEATSALDTENEKVVREALDAAKAGRTCVVIAHRLSTVRDADLICVLRGGRVAERGTHHQLMQLRGLYYNLNRRDAGYFY